MKITNRFEGKYIDSSSLWSFRRFDIALIIDLPTTLTYRWAAASLKTKQYQIKDKCKYRLYTNMMRHVDSSMYTYNANIKQELCDSIRTVINKILIRVILFARS